MEDHDTRRKIIREWMGLAKDKRHTEEQVVAFAKKATQQNKFHRSRRDPDHAVQPANCLDWPERHLRGGEVGVES